MLAPLPDLTDNVSEQLRKKCSEIKQNCMDFKYTYIRKCNNKECDNENSACLEIGKVVKIKTYIKHIKLRTRIANVSLNI